MSNEGKQLLLKDLCSRLPYNVYILYDNGSIKEIREMGLGSLHDLMFNNAVVKPYLRPMSSMTDEEIEYMEELSHFKCTLGYAIDKVNFCLKKHLDCYGLIKKGLALEAPSDMYDEKEK